MTLNRGDKVVFKNKEYEILEYRASSDSYWVRDSDLAMIVWSQHFVTSEFKKMRMILLGGPRCWHDYEEKPLFRFVYKTCRKCGMTDGVINMMEKKK